MRFRPDKHGFTLLELTVVIALIGVLAMTAIPTIMGLFRSGSDAQAYNVITAVLTAARAEAMQSGQYTAVRFAKAMDPATHNTETFPLISAENEETYWCSVLRMELDSSNNPVFVPAPGYTPRRLPGSMAVGEVRMNGRVAFVDAAGIYRNLPSSATDANLTTSDDYKDFTSFNVIFAPNGNVVRMPGGANIKVRFSNAGGADPRILFWQDVTQAPLFLTADRQASVDQYVIWEPYNATLDNECGAISMVLFDSKKFKNVFNPADPNGDRNTFMNANGQIIAINMYTGQLFPRK